jgi:hypothetical protein
MCMLHTMNAQNARTSRRATTTTTDDDSFGRKVIDERREEGYITEKTTVSLH